MWIVSHETTYDVVMISTIIVSTVGVIWASRKMEQARKAGKIRYIGKVRIDHEPK
jgi:hypothetical protein